MIPLGWTLEKGSHVFRLEQAERAPSEEIARKLLEDVPSTEELYNSKQFAKAVRHGLRRQDVKLSEKPKGGEGCRGDFLIKRSRATHEIKI